jgi:hypothetical protein
MICQIRGRFGGASVSPLPAPVVVSRGERGKTPPPPHDFTQSTWVARVLRATAPEHLHLLLHRVNRVPRESDVQGPSFLRRRVISGCALTTNVSRGRQTPEGGHERGDAQASHRYLQHRSAPAALRFTTFSVEQGSRAARYKLRLCDLAGAREPAEETEPIGEGLQQVSAEREGPQDVICKLHLDHVEI